MNKPIAPVLPFIWPEPLVSAGFNTYVTELPFDVAVRSAVSVFGVLSAIDARAVNWMEAARIWAEYRQLCLDKDVTGVLPVKAIVDPETGDVQLVDQNNDPVTSPTEEMGIQKLDPLAEYMARIFELGSLVSIDKLSRIPPLEAPVKPEWFGVDSFRQTGVVKAQTSIKVAPFDEVSSAVSSLLGQVRKRGLRRTLPRMAQGSSLPLWRNERGFRLQLGDEVRGIMAAARNYEPQSVSFPQDLSAEAQDWLERVDEAEIRKHLQRCLPVDSLLDWLNTHYSHLQDATLLRIFHDLQHESAWQFEGTPYIKSTDLQTIRVLHYPLRMSSTS